MKLLSKYMSFDKLTDRIGHRQVGIIRPEELCSTQSLWHEDDQVNVCVGDLSETK